MSKSIFDDQDGELLNPPGDIPGGPQLFRLVDQRQERIHRRLLLIGPGAADFFRDACRLMATKPPFATTTHLVSHAIREIESSLRDVLEPFISQEAQPPGRGKEKAEGQKDEIRSILRGLEISETEPVAEAWLALAGKGNEGALHARAHRDNLAQARPVNELFLKFWEDTQSVLDSILDRFEARYLHTHRVLDEYVNKMAPTREDANWIKQHVPNNQGAMWDFFFRLKSAAWLRPLEEEGFFNSPLAPSVDEKGMITHTHWPHSRYLSRMASLKDAEVQQTVLNILLKFETENISIHEDTIDAALSMPGPMAAQLARKEGEWTENQVQLFGLYPEKVGKLAGHLATEGEVDAALEFLGAVLMVTPDPKEATTEEKHLFWNPKPVTKLGDWEYRILLNGALPSLITAAGLQTLSLFCDLLETAVRLSRRPDEREPPDDHSDIWRTDIENLSRHGVEDSLVSAVRNIAKQTAEFDVALVPDIVKRLESHPWLIFKRLSFYMLRTHPLPDLIVERLLMRSNFEQRGLWQDYCALAKENFHLLEQEQQDQIVGWIDEGPDVEHVKKTAEKWTGQLLSDEQAEAEILQMKLGKLRPFREVLPEPWQKRYEEWSATLGELEPSPPPAYQPRWGLDTPKTQEELDALSVKDLVAFLKSWEPPAADPEFHQPSPEGLARELSAAVTTRLELFAAQAEQFKGLDPTYVRSLIGGVRTGVKSGRLLEWKPVLTLCRWVLDQPREIDDREGPCDKNDQNWLATRKEILQLLSAGLEKGTSEIAFELRPDVWELLSLLAEDPDPTPEQEASAGPNVDWADLAMNSVRGDALQTVLRYALWVKRHFDEEEDHVPRGFNEMTEVSDLLERHLDPATDSSLAIRSIYGRWIPWLLWLDSHWVENKLTRIFPRDEESTAFLKAAWESFVFWTSAYPALLPVLSEEYARAIGRIGLEPVPGAGSRGNPDNSLAAHLMMLYAHGRLSLDEEGGLLDLFFAKASDDLRAYAIWSIAYALREAKEDIPAEVIDRAKSLWKRRLDQIQTANRPGEHQRELENFGWLFVLKDFEDDWSLERLLDTLRLSGSVNADNEVVERLVKLSPLNRAAALECLRLMVENTAEEWKISYWGTHIRSILHDALQGNDDEVANRASDLVNRLAARGNPEFQDLLPARAIKYFAYGSNMLTKRLRRRAPSARFSSTARLTGHVLKFHKVSREKSGNRSGKCNALFTGRDEDYVVGVVFDIDRQEKAALDTAEAGYEETPLELTHRGEAVKGFMYSTANRDAIDDSVLPYDWYKALVVAGAKEHQLPAEYVQQIENVASLPDSDRERDKRNRKLL